MSQGQSQTSQMEVDFAFLKSSRGILKLAEMTTLFVAFVSFAVASTPKYIAATTMEFIITLLLMLLYTFKLNKRLDFLFWPLIDVFNSLFAAVFFIVLSIIAMTTYSVTGTLAGGIVAFMSSVLLCVDFYLLFKNITLNKLRNSETPSQTK